MSKWRQSDRAFPAQLVLAFAAVYLIWGSTYLAIRFAVETLPPFLMAGVRFLIAGGLLYGWARLRGAPPPMRAHWKAVAIVGAFLFLGGNGGVTWAAQRIPSGLNASLIATVPLWIVLLDWARPGGVRPSRQVIGGLVVGFLGVVLLVGPGNPASAGQIDLLGVAAVLLAALSWATGSLTSRGLSLPHLAAQSSAMQMLVGGVLLLGAGTLTGEWGRVHLEAVSIRSVLALAYLVVFGAIVAFSAYTWLLRESTPARAATYAYVNPMIAVFLGWALANETLTPQTLLASACIIGAVAVITTHRIKAHPASEPVEEEPQAVAVTAPGD